MLLHINIGGTNNTTLVYLSEFVEKKNLFIILPITCIITITVYKINNILLTDDVGMCFNVTGD
jgi:hypothetical protein